MEPNASSPQGDRRPEEETQPEVVPGSPWQEDEVWEAAGPGVVPAVEGMDEAAGQPEEREGSAAAKRFREEARAMGGLAARKRAEAARRLREFGHRAFCDQKERVAEEVGTVSSAIRRAADRLSGEHDRNLAEYAEAAAEHLDRMERYLRERSPGQMYHDLEGFARRRPELVVGGMFVAGVTLARLLKSKRPGRSSAYSGEGRLSGVAAGPLVGPDGEPLPPPESPPSRTASELGMPTSLPKTSSPEVK